MKVFLTDSRDDPSMDKVLQKHGDLVLLLRKLDPNLQVHHLVVRIRDQLYVIDYDELEPQGQSEFVEIVLDGRTTH